MSSPTKSDRVRDVISPAVREAGLYLEDVTVHPAGKRTLVRVTVDLEADQAGSLDLDALAEVSRAVGDALDESDVIRGEHVLEVSSPGTDRPLTAPRHFARARGRLVALVLADGTELTGRVVGADESSVELEGGRSIALADVARAKVEVELSRLADIDDDDLVEIDGHDDDGKV